MPRGRGRSLRPTGYGIPNGSPPCSAWKAAAFCACSVIDNAEHDLPSLAPGHDTRECRRRLGEVKHRVDSGMQSPLVDEACDLDQLLPVWLHDEVGGMHRCHGG